MSGPPLRGLAGRKQNNRMPHKQRWKLQSERTIMAQHNIEKWDLGYALLRPFVNLNYRGYFKNIYIRGKENIPDDTPLIYAPNHQNALMDALALVYSAPGQPVFLARSDIFHNPLIARILTFLKLLPIYRIRDGYDALQHNDRILAKVGDIMRSHKSLVIFPEGNHAPERRLRPLKKGICRIAFQAEARQHFNLGLKIIPVGLEYDNFYKFGHNLIIRFGQPIGVASYQELYRQNPSRALNALKQDIACALKKVMVHIDSPSYHDTINYLRAVYRPYMKNHTANGKQRYPEVLEEEKRSIVLWGNKVAAYPRQAAWLSQQTALYQRILSRLKLREKIVSASPHPWLPLLAKLVLVVVFFPLFLYGTVNNVLPFFLPLLAIRNVKDPQFWSSIKNGLALVLFPFFYGVQTLLVAIFSDASWIPWVYLIGLPLSGYLAYAWYVTAQKMGGQLRYNILWLRKTNMMKKLWDLKQSLIHTLDAWRKT